MNFSFRPSSSSRKLSSSMLFFFSLTLTLTFMKNNAVLAQNNEGRNITKVLFFLNGALEHAWAFRNELGRVAVAENLKDSVLTSVVTTNEWDRELTVRLAGEFIEDGYEVVFSCSTGFIPSSKTLARMYPHVLFVQMPGTDFTIDEPDLTNLVGVDGMLYQGSYLAGLLAGHMTKTEKIGFLTGVVTFLNAKAINAFCVGAMTVNPNVECSVIVMGVFTDPRLHKQGTQQLLDLGFDHVLGYSGNLIPAQMVAERYAQGEEVYTSGYTDDFRAKIGPVVASSAMFNWGRLYTEIVRRWIAGEHIENRVFAGLNMLQAVDIAPPSDIVPTDALPFFFSERERLLNADPGEELVFCGEAATAGLSENDPPVDPETGCTTVFADMNYWMDYMTVIEGDFYFNDVFVESDSTLYVIVTVAISICVVVSFVYFGLFLRFLPTPIIRIASPMFCIVIFIGAWLQLAASYMYLQKPTDAVCMVPMWLEMIGVMMMLSAIVVKNFRLWKLFKASSKFFPSAIPVEQLGAALAVGLLGMLTILTAWQATDPYLATTETSDDLEVDEQYLFCGETNEALWIGLVWGYLCIWIIAGVILAYLTRRVEGFFCETIEISLSLYNIAIMELIFLPLIYTMDLDQYKGQTVLLAVQPMYRAIATLSFIFIPKFYIALFYEELNTVQNIRTSTRSSVADGKKTPMEFDD